MSCVCLFSMQFISQVSIFGLTHSFYFYFFILCQPYYTISSFPTRSLLHYLMHCIASLFSSCLHLSLSQMSFLRSANLFSSAFIYTLIFFTFLSRFSHCLPRFSHLPCVLFALASACHFFHASRPSMLFQTPPCKFPSLFPCTIPNTSSFT